MISKPIDTSAPIHPLLAARYSGVSFDAARPVSSTDLRTLAEAARWAPSCFGDQPWRFIICSKTDNEAAWLRAHSCLSEKNKEWCQYVPVLILSCCDTLYAHNDTPNFYGPYDTGAAAMSICVQATVLGLMTHQMAGYSKDMAREVFHIPERYQPLAMMAVGYQLPEPAVPEQWRARELAPRKRSPLESRFFAGEWNKGL